MFGRTQTLGVSSSCRRRSHSSPWTPHTCLKTIRAGSAQRRRGGPWLCFERRAEFPVEPRQLVESGPSCRGPRRRRADAEPGFATQPPGRAVSSRFDPRSSERLCRKASRTLTRPSPHQPGSRYGSSVCHDLSYLGSLKSDPVGHVRPRPALRPCLPAPARCHIRHLAPAQRSRSGGAQGNLAMATLRESRHGGFAC